MQKNSGNFNPRCPSGQRPTIHLLEVEEGDISIHAAQVGSDTNLMLNARLLYISIHAAQVGSD